MAPLDHSFDWTSTTKEAFHAEVVGGREGIAPTATTAPRPVAGLQVVEGPRMERGRASGAPPDGQI
jgi:hypothetical protein